MTIFLRAPIGQPNQGYVLAGEVASTFRRDYDGFLHDGQPTQGEYDALDLQSGNALSLTLNFSEVVSII